LIFPAKQQEQAQLLCTIYPSGKTAQKMQVHIWIEHVYVLYNLHVSNHIINHHRKPFLD